MALKLSMLARSFVLSGIAQELTDDDDPPFGTYVNAEPVTFEVMSVDPGGFTVRLTEPMRMVLSPQRDTKEETL